MNDPSWVTDGGVVGIDQRAFQTLGRSRPRSSPHHAPLDRSWLISISACLLTMACTTSVGSPQGNLPDELAAVSASNPGPDAEAALEKCHIGDQIPLDRVVAMAKIPFARDLAHYIPLTGREPQLTEPGPAWVIQVQGDVQERGDEVWTDPTCVVTTNDAGYYATGQIRNTVTGDVLRPETPPVAPDRPLPTLAP
jgi:hypothetical protein